MANDKPTKPESELSDDDLAGVSGGAEPPEPERRAKLGLTNPIKPFLSDPPEPDKIGH